MVPTALVVVTGQPAQVESPDATLYVFGPQVKQPEYPVPGVYVSGKQGMGVMVFRGQYPPLGQIEHNDDPVEVKKVGFPVPSQTVFCWVVHGLVVVWVAAQIEHCTQLA